MDYMYYLLELHAGTKRQGPGTEAATKKALSLLKLPPKPEILDIGCGSGGQTLTILKNTSGTVTAVDLFPCFIERLKSCAKEANLANRLVAMRGDMEKLDFNRDRFDLIWSEGAIYILGFEKGLMLWNRFLRPGGYAVVSEASFLTAEPPAEVLSYWKDAYQGMKDVKSNITAAEKCGFEVLEHFTLEKEGWLDYYAPLKDNLPDFKKKYAKDEIALKVAAETEKEMEMYSKYSDHYGYVFYILKKK